METGFVTGCNPAGEVAQTADIFGEPGHWYGRLWAVRVDRERVEVGKGRKEEEGEWPLTGGDVRSGKMDGRKEGRSEARK